MVIVRAPVRISFGGGGTDLAAYYDRFGGLVLSAAITRYCYVVASDAVDEGIHITSSDYHVWERYARGVMPTVQEPLALPKAAIERFADVGRGLRSHGVDVFLAAEVPPGTGLGSSSAMGVALVRALAAHVHAPVDAPTAAELACVLEIDRLGMPIGKQDQYASAFGGVNTIEFTAQGVYVKPLRLPPDTVAALSSRLLLFSTGQSRNSSGILRQQQQSTVTDASVMSSLHRIKAFAIEMREALEAEDLDRFGQMLDLAWQQKKRLSGRISTASIDQWYAAARDAGALGGKITGAGGGGFLLLYAPIHKQKAVRQAMAQAGLREMSFAIDFTGATTVSEGTDEMTACPPLGPLSLHREVSDRTAHWCSSRPRPHPTSRQSARRG